MEYKLMLKQIRKSRGLTQKQAAELLDMNFYTYRSWEQGLVEIDLKDTLKICNAFDCSPNELAGWTLSKKNCPTLSDPFEIELINCYRASTDTRKAGILQVARDSAAMSKDAAERNSSESGKRKAI